MSGFAVGDETWIRTPSGPKRGVIVAYTSGIGIEAPCPVVRLDEGRHVVPGFNEVFATKQAAAWVVVIK